MNLCGLIDDTGLRQRLTLLAADAGWSCWMDDDPQIILRVLDTSQPAAELVVTDQPDHLDALAACAGRAPVVLLAQSAPASGDTGICIDPGQSDAELVLALQTCVNAQRFRERLAALDHPAAIPHLPRHDALLQSLATASGRTMGLLVVQVDHAQHLYQQLNASSRAELLQRLGERIRAALPQTARLGYYDPSCCVAILPDAGGAVVAATAEHVVTHLREPLAFQNSQLHLTVSVGYAAQAALDDPERLWTDAWHAMRRALTHRGDRACGGDENAMAARLPQALARAEFSLVVQPQIAVADGHMTGAEVLLRWQGLEVGELSPSHFIPVAESRGHMARIGDWVLEQTARAAATWLENRAGSVLLGVNVSPQQFRGGAILEQIARMRAKRWLDPALLELEMSHDAALRLLEEHREQVYRLRDLGVRFALDNLGDGLVDTKRLLRCPVDTLKIDRALVGRIDTDPRARDLAEQFCALGARSGLRVVGVGVERETQRSLLLGMGCTDIQGYLITPPITWQRFGELLAGTGRSSGLEYRDHLARR